MSAVQLRPTLAFHSRDYERRIGLIPMRIFMVLGWTVSVMSILIASWVFRIYPLYSSLWIFAACGLAIYMAFVTRRWIKDSQLTHTLTFDNNRVKLVTHNSRSNEQWTQVVDLNDVKGAEHYRAQDTGSILLRTQESDLDIPLWSFGPKAEQNIVSYLSDKGVKITTIP